METVIRTSFSPSDAGGIVLPNLAALRRTLYAIGELLGVTPRQVKALVTATERIRLTRKPDGFSEKMLTNPQAWLRWSIAQTSHKKRWPYRYSRCSTP